MIEHFLEEVESEHSEPNSEPSELKGEKSSALQSFLRRHGFMSIYSARQANCQVVRMDARPMFGFAFG